MNYPQKKLRKDLGQKIRLKRNEIKYKEVKEKLERIYNVQEKSIAVVHEEVPQVDRREGKTWKVTGKQDSSVQTELPVWIKSEKVVWRFRGMEKRHFDTRCRRERNILVWYLGLHSMAQWKCKMVGRTKKKMRKN